jgi:uncharacterized membrane protein YgcG
MALRHIRTCHSDRSEPASPASGVEEPRRASEQTSSRSGFARFVRRRPLLYFLSLLYLLYLPPSVALATKELRIETFDSEIVVSPNGSIDVTENIRAHFIGGPWHGLYRTIPVEYFTPQGLNYTLFLEVKSVIDGNGNQLKFESSRERHYRKLKIFVPEADNTTRTISINYTVADALRFFEDHDELYWNVTGDAWDVPIQSASERVVLPERTTGIRTNVFTGAYGSRAHNADAEVVGNGAVFHTTDPLRYHEGLTIAVAFDKGFVHQPSSFEIFLRTLRSNLPLLIPVFVFFLMFYLWWTRGRDPRLRPISAQYEPPDKLTPGEVGALVDESADMRDITASIVDLAVRGYLSIEEKQKDHMLGLWHDKNYIFHLKKPRSEWSALKPHEQDLIGGLFADGDDVSLSDLQNRFYRFLPNIKNDILDSLVQHGYYARRPDRVRSAYIGAGFVIGFIMVWGGNAVASSLGMAPLSFIVAGVLSGIIICAFGWFMPAHTEQGTRALEGALGFEDFLSHVEADRFNRTIKTPEMFEKFLPFAMALGVEKNWSKAFQGIYTQPPSWYQGGYGPNFYPIIFVNDLNLMSTQASSVMASAPRSSGGSGFGGGDGGGSSGGGFGGGGGGGF